MASPTTPSAPSTNTSATQTTAGTTAQANTPVPEAAPAKTEAARTFKLKVDGQEVEMSEREVLDLAQQGKSANKRFQEASVTRKEAEQIIAFAKSNPAEFFAKTGQNARQWAEDFLLQEIQREQMSPEQKKAFENEQKLRKYEDTEKQTKEQARQDQMAKLEQQQMQSYDKLFVEALTASGLPKTPYTVKRMAELTLVNIKNKLELEPSQLAKIVREDYESEMKALYGQADGDTLLALLGKDAVKKLSKAQLSRYKSAKTNSSKAQEKPANKKDDFNPIGAWKEMQRKTRRLI